MEFLLGKSCCIEECSFGCEVLFCFNCCDIDVVVFDLKLLDIGGIEIMDWLMCNYVVILVVVFSVDELVDLVIYVLCYGVFEFICKYCDFDELIEVVDCVLCCCWMEQEYVLMMVRFEQFECLYCFFVEQLLDLIYIFDSDGYFIFINGCIELLFGYIWEELIGQYYLIIVYEDDVEQVCYVFNECCIGECVMNNFEVCFRNKQFGVCYFESRMIVVIFSLQGIYVLDGNILQ